MLGERAGLGGIKTGVIELGDYLGWDGDPEKTGITGGFIQIGDDDIYLLTCSHNVRDITNGGSQYIGGGVVTSPSLAKLNTIRGYTRESIERYERVLNDTSPNSHRYRLSNIEEDRGGERGAQKMRRG